jgi:hypothetical protein
MMHKANLALLPRFYAAEHHNVNVSTSDAAVQHALCAGVVH